MKKNLFKLYLLLFVPLFLLSSLTKGAEHTDLQMELYIAELKLLETETKDLLQKFGDTATTPVEKANFVKTYQDVIYRLFTRFNSLNDKVLKALNVKNSYSEMSRDEVSKTLKRGQRRQVTKECSCNPCTKTPCLDNQVWANEFWKFMKIITFIDNHENEFLFENP